MDNEDSLVEYVKTLSLETLTSRTDYTYDQIKRIATVQKNISTIETPDGKYLKNKCFFIALSNGLLKYGIEQTAFQLALECNMINDEMVDTDNAMHRKFLLELTNHYHIKIEVYFGRLGKDKQWYTSPHITQVFGFGSKIIRILNEYESVHFELLVDLEHGFLTDENITKDTAITEQISAFKKMEEDLATKKLIAQFQKEDEHFIEEQTRWFEERKKREERKKKEQEEKDRIFAIQLDKAQHEKETIRIYRV